MNISDFETPFIIAFYLPQYYPFPQNDKWWGKGFTEWTNVGKAKPLFRGHYQPKVPADLGYYDLRMPEVRKAQSDLAKEAGVGGFCYWHYWFGGKGRQLLNDIIDDVIATGEPAFPFCFGWANESWKAKQWNKDGRGDVMLMEQTYGGELDYKEHFEYALKAFKDKRYIKIDNKPLFVIYKPYLLPDDFIPCWNKLAKEAGFDGITFLARLADFEDEQIVTDKHFDLYTRGRERFVYYKSGKYNFYKYKIKSWLKGLKGTAIPYKNCIEYMKDYNEDMKENFCPYILPNWDHSPRSGRSAYILYDSEPQYFYKHAKEILTEVRNKTNKIIFLKSWNEWGEGNYMEPDLKYGKGYINALRKAFEDSNNNQKTRNLEIGMPSV